MKLINGINGINADYAFNRFFLLSLFAERWLRHVDRLPTDIRKRERVFDWVAIGCAIIGSAGLILCSIVSFVRFVFVHIFSSLSHLQPPPNFEKTGY